MLKLFPWITRALGLVFLATIGKTIHDHGSTALDACIDGSSNAIWIRIVEPSLSLPFPIYSVIKGLSKGLNVFLCAVTPIFMNAKYGDNIWSVRMVEIFNQLMLAYTVFAGVEAIQRHKKSSIVFLVPLVFLLAQTVTIAVAVTIFWFPALWAFDKHESIHTVPSLTKLYALMTTTFFLLVPGLASLTVFDLQYFLEAVTIFQFLPVIVPILYLTPGLDFFMSLPMRVIFPAKNRNPTQALKIFYILNMGLMWLMHSAHLVNTIQMCVAAGRSGLKYPPMTSLFNVDKEEDVGRFILVLDFMVVWLATFIAIIRDQVMYKKTFMGGVKSVFGYFLQAVLMGPGGMLMKWRLDHLEAFERGKSKIT